MDYMGGPTHYFGGLAYGNTASTSSAGTISNPKKAALQGLQKMKMVADLGAVQLVLPPQIRPFRGSFSSAFMWTANAATVSSKMDSRDQHLHFTVANMSNTPHRSIEWEQTQRIIDAVFPHESGVDIHAPIDSDFGDEGAANHMRLGDTTNAGFHVFVYGKSQTSTNSPVHFPVRQSLESQEAIAERHGLDISDVMYIQQHPNAIDAGVFHNDVIAFAAGSILFCHEYSFLDQETVVEILKHRVKTTQGVDLSVVQVSETEVSLEDVVASFMFNSQVVNSPSLGGRVLLYPKRCEAFPNVMVVMERWLEQGMFVKMIPVDLDQSMKNGGGPACLRLRAVCEKSREFPYGFVMNDARFEALSAFVDTHYPDRLTEADFQDPKFVSSLVPIYKALYKDFCISIPLLFGGVEGLEQYKR
jgi:succinylarginine dihydrolase